MLPESGYVLLKEIETGKTRRVEQGKTINGLLLEKIEQERVTLTQYDDAEEITMKVQPSAAQTAASTAAAATQAALVNKVASERQNWSRRALQRANQGVPNVPAPSAPAPK